jgi:hypothetical protein
MEKFMGINEEKKSAIIMTLRILSGLFLIAFFAFAGLTFYNARTRDRMAVTNYFDLSNGFLVDYPKEWRIEKQEIPLVGSKNKGSISFINPAGDIDGDFLGSAGITVSFDYSDGPQDLEQLKNIVKNDMRNRLDDFTIISEEKASFNGLDGYLIFASDSGEKEGDTLKKPLYNSLIFVAIEEKTGRDFLIWATSFKSKWDNYENLFLNCIKSFKIPQ